MSGLGIRLGTILELAEGELVCDVGCDHGHLSIELIESGRAKRVIASDLREGPLARARTNVSEAGLADRIELVCADGISHLEGQHPDCIVIAGMGGPLIESIIRAGEDTAKGAKLILSPQSHVPEFRSFLWDSGFEILTDRMVIEEEKYYTIIAAFYKGSPISYSYRDTLIGKSPNPDMDDVFRTFIEKRRDQINGILESVPEGDRRNELIRELEALGE